MSHDMVDSMLGGELYSGWRLRKVLLFIRAERLVKGRLSFRKKKHLAFIR